MHDALSVVLSEEGPPAQPKQTDLCVSHNLVGGRRVVVLWIAIRCAARWQDGQFWVIPERTPEAARGHRGG